MRWPKVRKTWDDAPRYQPPAIFDTRHAGDADHDRAKRDADYLLNAEDWPSTRTPITASMLGNLSRAYIELREQGQSEPLTIWCVCESDDYTEAAFTTREAAEACRERKSAESLAKFGSDHYWWIDEIPLDPQSDDA